MIHPGIFPGKLLVLLDRYFLGGDGEPAGDEPAVRQLIGGVPIGLGRRRAHAELDRAVDQGEGLALAVDQPAASVSVLELEELGVGGFELGLLVPLLQGP